MAPDTASGDPSPEITPKDLQILRRNPSFGRVVGNRVSEKSPGQSQISQEDRELQRSITTQKIPQSIGDANEDVNTCLDTLSMVFETIYAGKSSTLSFEHCYRNCYKIVLKKRGGVLYDMFRSCNDLWLRRNFLEQFGDLALNLSDYSSLPSANNNDISLDERKIAGDKLLIGFRDTWENYCRYVAMCTDILMYLDRVYCAEEKKTGIYFSCMTSLRDHVLRLSLPGHASGNTISRLVTTVIFDQITISRLGSKVDHDSIRSCIFVLENIFEIYGKRETIEFWGNSNPVEGSHSTDLARYGRSFDSNCSVSLYTTRFEPQFLETSGEFYDAEGLTLAANTSALDFCRKVRRRLLEEEVRSHSMLSRQVESKTKAMIDIHMTMPYISRLIELDSAGVRALLNDRSVKELGIIYEILARVDEEKQALKVVVRNWILESGSEILHRYPEMDKEETGMQGGEAAGLPWVRDIVQLRNNLYDIVERAFHSDSRILTTGLSAISDMMEECRESRQYLVHSVEEGLKDGPANS